MQPYDHESAEKLEAWYRSETGRECFRLQMALILRLLKPRVGERLLDVGCGSGFHLQAFKREGLTVTGLDPSPVMLDLARRRMGAAASLTPGRAEDLPFDDNEFDIVSLIYCLELVDDPAAAVAEAFRVARNRIFIGVTNALSIDCVSWRVRDLWSRDSSLKVRFFSPWDLAGLVRSVCGPSPTRWSTVGVLPRFLAGRAPSFESYPLVQKNPFGAFLGAVAKVVYTYHTDNLAVDTSLSLTGKKCPAPTTYGRYRAKSWTRTGSARTGGEGSYAGSTALRPAG